MIKQLFLALFLFMLFQDLAKADLSIVMKGNWTVLCAGELISTHNRYDKALESAINQKKNCDIIPPDRFEVRVEDTTPTTPTTPTNIDLTWDIPQEREDGTPIEKIDRFNLYVYLDNVLQSVIEIPSDSTSFQLPEVRAGTWSFEISTVELGQEGKKSPMIHQEV